MIGVEGLEGPENPREFFYGLGYMVLGVALTALGLLTGLVAVTRTGGRRRRSAVAKFDFRVSLVTAVIFATAVVGMCLQATSIA